MKRLIGPALLLVLAFSASGCGALSGLFGQNDDTVLPGAREDAIPGRSQFPEPGDTGLAQASPSQDQATAPAPDVVAPPPCPKADTKCQDAATSTDGTFSDGQ